MFLRFSYLSSRSISSFSSFSSFPLPPPLTPSSLHYNNNSIHQTLPQTHNKQISQIPPIRHSSFLSHSLQNSFSSLSSFSPHGNREREREKRWWNFFLGAFLVFYVTPKTSVFAQEEEEEEKGEEKKDQKGSGGGDGKKKKKKKKLLLSQLKKNYNNRIRDWSSPEKIFNVFASVTPSSSSSSSSTTTEDPTTTTTTTTTTTSPSSSPSSPSSPSPPSSSPSPSSPSSSSPPPPTTSNQAGPHTHMTLRNFVDSILPSDYRQNGDDRDIVIPPFFELTFRGGASLLSFSDFLFLRTLLSVPNSKGWNALTLHFAAGEEIVKMTCENYQDLQNQKCEESNLRLEVQNLTQQIVKLQESQLQLQETLQTLLSHL